MPNKTIYVSDEDQPLFSRAQELAGGNLSSAIAVAIRRFVDIEEGRLEGFQEVIVTVGPGGVRKQRFSGALLGEWVHTTSTRVDAYRVYVTRSGKYAVHETKSAEWKSGNEKWNTGWRSWIGDWSANQTWGFTTGASNLHVADTIDDLQKILPADIYPAVVAAAASPGIEDLDI